MNHMEQSGEQNHVSNCTKEVKASPNVWIVPLPWFSHMLCHLNLAKQLAKYGLTVTFCAPDDEIQHMVASELITQESWEREGLDIRLQPIVIPPMNLGHGEGVPNTLKRLIRCVADTENAFEKALKTTLNSHLAPTCVISDIWLPETREVAAQNNIPAWVLCSFSSAYLASTYYVHLLGSKGMLKLPRLSNDPEFQNEVLCLPGLAVFPYQDLPVGCLTEQPIFQNSRRNVLSLEKADVVLVASFKELDGRSFRELENLLRAASIRNHRKVPHVWTIGPTFQFLSLTDDAGDEEKHPILKFLDSQLKSSVLYVAFGSDGNHSREQILEIAHGLENSEQPFLCVLHPPLKTADCQIDDLFSVIPPDCVERTKHRGLFVQRWAPQMKVLSHPSTGGFLSHCGFNSLLESVCMGVPLLGWPLFADQSLNTRWVVDEAQIGLEIRKGPDGFVDRREVERGVKALFHTDEGRAVRKKLLELKELAKETVGENGSTTKHMQALVDLIRVLQVSDKRSEERTFYHKAIEESQLQNTHHQDVWITVAALLLPISRSLVLSFNIKQRACREASDLSVRGPLLTLNLEWRDTVQFKQTSSSSGSDSDDEDFLSSSDEDEDNMEDILEIGGMLKSCRYMDNRVRFAKSCDFL